MAGKAELMPTWYTDNPSVLFMGNPSYKVVCRISKEELDRAMKMSNVLDCWKCKGLPK